MVAVAVFASALVACLVTPFWPVDALCIILVDTDVVCPKVSTLIAEINVIPPSSYDIAVWVGCT